MIHASWIFETILRLGCDVPITTNKNVSAAKNAIESVYQLKYWTVRLVAGY